MKQLILFLMLLQGTISFGQTITKKNITVEAALSYQSYEHFNRLTLESFDSHAEYIDGFDFDWGYKYVLYVKETKLAETLSDGTQYDYELIKIVSKTKVDDSKIFRLYLDSEIYPTQAENAANGGETTLVKLNDSLYRYFEEIEIEVPEELREQFEEVATGNRRCVGHFAFMGDHRIRLLRL